MREDRCYGHTNPKSRENVVIAAADLYCSICDARPCYLLTSAAMSVINEQLTENDCYNSINLKSAMLYMQSLERLHGCIARHTEVTREAWQMDNHLRVSEEALRELERQGVDTQRLDTRKEARIESPTN